MTFTGNAINHVSGCRDEKTMKSQVVWQMRALSRSRRARSRLAFQSDFGRCAHCPVAEECGVNWPRQWLSIITPEGDKMRYVNLSGCGDEMIMKSQGFGGCWNCPMTEERGVDWSRQWLSIITSKGIEMRYGNLMIGTPDCLPVNLSAE
ncbi:hypothetical protein CEXT_61051 [Caerostris extrusa]|uniref:Uncharacterized protein n=1 Tax=Caerostris extrusa TaxID=172846 RepID=A0AAV4SKC3_CAEEX|nr:hypothetical protein CEXT_61051 [Caerostris extrusa]